MSSKLGQINLFTSELLPYLPLNAKINVVRAITFFFIFIRSSSNLRIISTCIKSGSVRICAISDYSLQIYSNMNSKINVSRSISYLIFHPIFIKLADNPHMHKISDEFKFGPDMIIPFRFTCAWMPKLKLFDL